VLFKLTISFQTERRETLREWNQTGLYSSIWVSWADSGSGHAVPDDFLGVDLINVSHFYILNFFQVVSHELVFSIASWGTENRSNVGMFFASLSWFKFRQACFLGYDTLVSIRSCKFWWLACVFQKLFTFLPTRFWCSTLQLTTRWSRFAFENMLPPLECLFNFCVDFSRKIVFRSLNSFQWWRTSMDATYRSKKSRASLRLLRALHSKLSGRIQTKVCSFLTIPQYWKMI
jgi:hypothetical protein